MYIEPMTLNLSKPAACDWGALFEERLGRVSLRETQRWCQARGLPDMAWLDAVWQDDQGRSWSALSRLGYLWMTPAGQAACSEDTLVAALKALPEKTWPTTMTGEADLAWVWLGCLAQETFPDSLYVAFKSAPRVADDSRPCGTGTGEGWMTAAVNQLLWFASAHTPADPVQVQRVDRVLHGLVQGMLWWNQEHDLASPWSMGRLRPTPPERLRFEQPRVLHSKEGFSALWNTVCRVHIAFIRQRLVNTAYLFPPSAQPNYFSSYLERLTPEAVQQGWAVVREESRWEAHMPRYPRMRLEGTQLASLLAWQGPPEGWEQADLQHLQRVLHPDAASERLASMVRQVVLDASLPSSSAGPKPRF